MNISFADMPCPFCGERHEVHTVKKVIDYDEQGKPICDDGKQFVYLTCAPQGNTYPYIPLDLWNNRKAARK